MNELFVSDRNTWNHLTTCKEWIADVKSGMEYWKYSLDYNETFRNETNVFFE